MVYLSDNRFLLDSYSKHGHLRNVDCFFGSCECVFVINVWWDLGH